MQSIITMSFLKGFIQGLLLLWQLWVILGIVLIIKLALKIFEKQRLVKSGIHEIDQMSGKTFEKYLEALFEKLGYRVERTRYIGDYGADLVTTKDGVKTIIQAKRFKQKVGIKAIQEAVAAKGYYGCSKAMVVTNSFYTKQAIELAKANDVELWNRDNLVKALLTIKKEGKFINPAVEEVAASIATVSRDEGNADVCVICGKIVSDKVKQYCLANEQRFGGKIYCYDHQKNAK